MAQNLKLNTATSVVDFLKAQGKASDFSSRKSLYQTSGLGDRLGSYTGSSNQNVAFLKSLQTATSPTPSAPQPTPQITPSPTPTPTPAMTPPPVQPQPQTIGSSGISASEALSSIPELPTSEDILKDVLKSSKFQNFQQSQDLSREYDIGEAQAQKEGFERTTAADTKEFINNLGRRGLFFSGERVEGLQTLAEDLAISKLGVDRKLAVSLLESDLKTKKEIIDEVGQLVTDAQTGRKEAISALEKVGLTVIGDQVVPTLAAQSAERAAEREERLVQSSEFSQVLALQREGRSEEASQRAEQYLAIALNREARAEADEKVGAGFTQTQLNVGASNADMSIEAFKALPTDTKNYFINGPIEVQKKSIGESLDAGLPLEKVQDSILNKTTIPSQARKTLLDYANSYESVQTDSSWTSALLKGIVDFF